MAKIGRNEPCPCGSGLKYKKCCLAKQSRESAGTPQTEKISITNEVTKLQQAAADKKPLFKAVGVFILMASPDGDAWLLELSDKDALFVANKGVAEDVEIDESAETIEINWTHRFEIKDKKFTTTTYKDNVLEVHENYPAKEIQKALNNLSRNFSTQLLDSIHVDQS